MAACRCNICKSRREPVTVVVAENRFHAEAKLYKVEGGQVLPNGVQHVMHLLYDFERGHSDVGPIDFGLVESYIQNNPRWYVYLRGDTDLPIGELFLQYLENIPGMRRNGMNILPDYYPVAGRDEAERIKNAKACLKKWIRWYTDRTSKIDCPSIGWARLVESVGPLWVSKEGKFTTRLTAELFKYKIKLSKDQLETVANSLNDYVLRDGEYSFTFDQGFVKGSAEDYCHRDSCWWGGYAKARPVLKANDGYAIRMWDKGKPVARCWIAPAADGYVLFNAYGKLDLGMFTQVLAENWGMKFAKCSLEYPETLYINNGSGFHIHADSPQTRVELLWSEKVDKPYSPPANPCTVCGEDRLVGEREVCNACEVRDMTPVEVLTAAGVQNVQAVQTNNGSWIATGPMPNYATTWTRPSAIPIQWAEIEAVLNPATILTIAGAAQ